MHAVVGVHDGERVAADPVHLRYAVDPVGARTHVEHSEIVVDRDDRVDDRVEDRPRGLETRGQCTLVFDLGSDVATGREHHALTALTAPLDPAVLAVTAPLAIAELHQRGVRK